MLGDFSSGTQKYMESRDDFRRRTQNNWREFNENANLLMGPTNELITQLTFAVSEKRLEAIDNGPYCNNLMVSFCRSHFIAADLVLSGDLVEAIVIICKQINLLGRLDALGKSMDLERVVPEKDHIDHIRSCLKPLYCDYFEHCTTPNVTKLLGGQEEWASDSRSLVCAEFQKNAHATLQHLTMTAFLYYLRADPFLRDHFADYDGVHEKMLFETAYKQHSKIYPGEPLSWRRS